MLVPNDQNDRKHWERGDDIFEGEKKGMSHPYQQRVQRDSLIWVWLVTSLNATVFLGVFSVLNQPRFNKTAWNLLNARGCLIGREPSEEMSVIRFDRRAPIVVLLLMPLYSNSTDYFRILISASASVSVISSNSSLIARKWLKPLKDNVDLNNGYIPARTWILKVYFFH